TLAPFLGWQAHWYFPARLHVAASIRDIERVHPRDRLRLPLRRDHQLCPHQQAIAFAIVSVAWVDVRNIPARAHRVDRRSDFYGRLLWQLVLPAHGSILGDPVHPAPSEAPVG